MHIPENYLSPSTCGVFAVAMVPVWVHAARQIKKELPQERLPLLGIAAALSFLAMMFNVPVPGGTTGHAVCGTLIAILFGPWPAVIALSIALGLQAILFGDGGILALGANCFNMALVLPMVGYGIYHLLRGKDDERSLRRELVAAGIGSYLGINAAALCAALELGIQPLLFTNAAGQALYCPYPLWMSVPAMLAAHLTVCGAAEALFTVGILGYIRKTAPSFAPDSTSADASASTVHQEIAPRALILLIVALIILVPLGLLAEGDAWGEWSAEDVAQAVGYGPQGMMQGWEWPSLLPDYSFGGLPDWIGYVLSALIGVAILIIIFRIAGSHKQNKAGLGGF